MEKRLRTMEHVGKSVEMKDWQGHPQNLVIKHVKDINITHMVFRITCASSREQKMIMFSGIFTLNDV